MKVKHYLLICIILIVSAGFSQTIPDSNYVAGCGISSDEISRYMKGYEDYRKKKDDPNYSPDSPIVPFTAKENFPDSGIIRCGNFRIYYEDFLHLPKAGFANTSNGSNRRNILCQVLQYVQSIIYIQSGDTLDLYVDRSWSNSNLPLAQYQHALAAGGPYFPISWGNVPGIYNGNMFNHIVAGIDPDTLNYDAFLVTNFTKNFIDDTSAQVTTPLYDLYSVLLHEITHTLGFLSGIKEGTTIDHYPTSDSNSFSRYDSIFLYHGAHNDIGNLTKLIVFDVNGSPSIDPTLAITQNCLRTNKVWLTNDTSSVNQPVYSGEYEANSGSILSESLLSHLNMSPFSLVLMSQFLPGYQPLYVMGPRATNYCDFRRKWTIPEIRIINTLGYTLRSDFLNATCLNGLDSNYFVLANSSPYRRDFKQKITDMQQNYFFFPDTITPDTTIYNYNTYNPQNLTTCQIYISNNSSYIDNDNDPITVYPNSIFGIRGVDTLGNEHSQLELAQDNSYILFTPYPHFSGRAQFGFYLYDGYEKGALVIYTIDVIDPIDSLEFNKELVINGTFEDGTEFRQYKNSITLNKPSCDYDFHYSLPGEYCRGIHFSGGHPFSQLSANAYSSGYHTNGVETCSNSIYKSCCYSSSNSESLFNSVSRSSIDSCFFLNGFPNAFDPLPKQSDQFNERYRLFRPGLHFFTLKDSLQACSKLVFNLDLCYKDTSLAPDLNSQAGFIIGDTLRFRIEFVSDPHPDPTAVSIFYSKDYYDIVDSLTTNCSIPIWSHFSDTLNYCGNNCKYIRLVNLSCFVNNDVFYNRKRNLPIDNVSLKLLPSQPLVLNIQSDTNQICQGESLSITALTVDTVCPVTYLWSPGNDTTKTITATPTSTTTYYVTVTNGCSSKVDSITILVNPIPSAVASYDQPVCQGGTIYLHANQNLPGDSIYNWSGPNAFYSQLRNPIISNVNGNMVGNYYLTVTNEFGCINIDTLFVSIDTTPQPQGNPNYYIDCPGDTLFLYASSGYPYYIWWGPDSFFSTVQNPIVPNVTPSNNGYYYLMVYNSSYCMDIDSIYVSVTTAAAGLGLSSNAPICSHDTLNLFSGVGDSYYWTGPNGYISNNQNPLITNVDTLDTGWYFCYIKDSSGCSYDSLFIEIVYCCSDSIVTLLTYDLISGYGDPLPLNIAIPEELIFDADYTFTPNSNIIMLPKSSMTVLDGINLEIDSAYIHGCLELWNSIYLEESAGLSLTNSVIEDAEYAITINKNPNINISNNHFHKNYVGLYSAEPDPWDNMLSLGSFTFSGNEFDCQDDVLLPPYAGYKSKAGVWLHSVIAVSLYGNDINSYHHMRNGILSYNTNLEVINSRFYNISDSSGNGCGIYAESYDHAFNLVQKGWGSIQDTTFQHCDIGIQAFRMNTAISYNTMHDVSTAIYLIGSPYTYQFMTNNYLNCRNYGIVAALNDPVMLMDITENIIKMNSTSASAGIYLFEWRNPPVEYTKIHNNYIYMDTSYMGIKLINSSNTEIYENYIAMSKPFQNYYGISLDYCPNSFVSCNEVHGINDSLGQMASLLPRGLNVKECYTSIFSCNSFSNTVIGAHFENRCYDDSIRGNTFYNHYYGLHYNKYCITGPQRHHGNKWLGSYNIAAKHDTTAGYFYVYQNLYRVKTNPSYLVPTTWDPTVWFNATPDTATFYCTNCPKLDTLGSFDSIFSPLDYAIANGLTVEDEYQETSQWLSSRYLLSKLISDSLLATSDTVMQNFYDTTQYASSGLYQFIDFKTKKTFSLDLVSKTIVDSLANQIETTLKDISITDSLLNSVVSFNDSLELLIEKEILVNSLEDLNAQLSAVMQGIKTIQQSIIDTVLAQNQSLPTSELYELNENSINDIYLHTVAKGIFTLTPEQITIVANIASQCPLAGGNAVYQARSLYALFHDTIFDDQVLCLQAGIKNQEKQETNLKKENPFKIFPNPTSNSVTIEWQNIRDETAFIEFITPLGQTYFKESFSLSSGTLNISLENWLPGLYQVCITYLNNKVNCDKLIIMK